MDRSLKIKGGFKSREEFRRAMAACNQAGFKPNYLKSEEERIKTARDYDRRNAQPSNDDYTVLQ